MNVSLPLQKMTPEEKLQVMEAIWDDLYSRAAEADPPAWHGELLKEREAVVARGEAEFEDWEDARQRIDKEIG